MEVLVEGCRLKAWRTFEAGGNDYKSATMSCGSNGSTKMLTIVAVCEFEAIWSIVVQKNPGGEYAMVVKRPTFFRKPIPDFPYPPFLVHLLFLSFVHLLE